jgi:hypothetical protein
MQPQFLPSGAVDEKFYLAFLIVALIGLAVIGIGIYSVLHPKTEAKAPAVTRERRETQCQNFHVPGDTEDFNGHRYYRKGELSLMQKTI